MCGFCEISFKCSINQLLEYRDLTKFIAAKFLTSFTFTLKRIPKWQFLIIFCYTEFLFSRHSESDQTLISFRISRYRISRSNQLLEHHDLTEVIAARLLTGKELGIWPNCHFFSLILSFYSHLSHLTKHSSKAHFQTLKPLLSNFLMSYFQ